MAYGMLSTLGVSAQQSLGTATTSFEFMPLISESLTTNIEQLVEEGMRGRFEEGPTQVGLTTVTGDVVFEPHPVLFGHILRGLTGIASGTVSTSHYIWTYTPPQTDFGTESALPPYTFKVHRDVGSTYLFTDVVVNALNIEITGNAIVRATATVMARISSLDAVSAATYPTGDPWLWSSTSLAIAGTANAEMESLTFTWENNVEGVDLLDNTNRWTKFKRTGFRTFGLSGVLNYDAQTEYNNFISQTEQRFVVNLSGTQINSGVNAEFRIDLPSLRYTTYPVNAAGPGRTSVSWEGVGKYNTGSGNAVTLTLVNTRANYAV